MAQRLPRRTRTHRRPRKRPWAALVVAATIGATASGCRGRPADVKGLCALSKAAAKAGNRDRLLVEISRQFDVEASKLRVQPGLGVYVPTWQFFVVEKGWFVAEPGATLLRGGDPSYEWIDLCLYRYEIKG